MGYTVDPDVTCRRMWMFLLSLVLSSVFFCKIVFCFNEGLRSSCVPALAAFGIHGMASELLVQDDAEIIAIADFEAAHTNLLPSRSRSADSPDSTLKNGVGGNATRQCGTKTSQKRAFNFLAYASV